MRVQPRQQLLEIWQAVVRTSWQDGAWQWGGRHGPNSISDAEQVLCLLLPATQIPAFGVDRPDETADEVLRVLRPLGTVTEIPRVLIRVLTDYYMRYTDETDTPIFSGGSYFPVDDGRDPPTEEQLRLDIVDSFAISVTLSLATLSFVRVFRRAVRRDAILREIDHLEEMASTRLSAALVGLLRSFTVNVFDIDSPQGQDLLRTINQDFLPQRQVVNQLRRDLRQTIASFREVMIGSGQVVELESPQRLFECGWSWGIVRDAPEVDTTERIGKQPRGAAPDLPYLYFTVVAIDAIEDLFSERTRILGLLNEEQQRLSRALQLRWELTRTYWATVATFGSGQRWPLEDIPWRIGDQNESDYYTVMVTSLTVKGLVSERGSDPELARVGAVLAELAHRARITRRPYGTDPALEVHDPGVRLRLIGTEQVGESRLEWTVSDFSPVLLQRTSVIASLLSDADQRAALLELADQVWEHLLVRRLDSGPDRRLWDQPGNAFEQLPLRYERVSWYHTVRVVQALVSTANVLSRPPLPSDRLTAVGLDLLREAEHLYDMELLSGAAESGPRIQQTLQRVRVNLLRAREIMSDRPGTAAVLAQESLRILDELAAARLDISEAS